MGNLTLFPDHQIIQNILMQDINILYSDLKVKVDIPIKPIYHEIDKLIRNQLPFFPKMKISSSSKEPKRTRLRNTRTYWAYKNPQLALRKELHFFIQLGDFRAGRKRTIFWGVSYWVGGVSDEIDSVYNLFKRIGKINVVKEHEGVGGIADKGTTVLGIINQYTSTQLLNLQSDIKLEIAEGIGNLFQKMEKIIEDTAVDHSFHPAVHVPGKADIEFAESQLRNSPEELIGIESVLNQIGENFHNTGQPLDSNWREVTIRNIEIWFKK